MDRNRAKEGRPNSKTWATDLKFTVNSRSDTLEAYVPRNNKSSIDRDG